MKFPKHEASLYLTHNEHKSYYDTAEKWIAQDGDRLQWESEEAKARSIATDEVWALQWYPNTPVGFNAVAAPTLEEVLAFALKYEAADD